MDLEIKKSKYQGYVWYSDQTEPQILDGEDFELKRNAMENPFVIEALLYDGAHSIQVKYVDGSYLVRNICIKDVEGKLSFEPAEDMEFYLPNRMDLKGKVLAFKRYWKQMADPMCEDMKVLVPQPLVFVGFEKM